MLIVNNRSMICTQSLHVNACEKHRKSMKKANEKFDSLTIVFLFSFQLVPSLYVKKLYFMVLIAKCDGTDPKF